MLRKVSLAFGMIGVMLVTTASARSDDEPPALLLGLDESWVVELSAGCCAGCPPSGPCEVDHKCSNGSCVEAAGKNCSPSGEVE